MSSKLTKAIALCRVSSDEQLKNNSLVRQNEAVMKMAERLGAIVPEGYVWSGSVSSKCGENMKRKDLNEMLEVCKRERTVKYLIVDEPDRFMRSIKEAFAWETRFEEYGVKVVYTDEDLNSDDMQGKLLRFLKYFQAEGSNEERMSKARKGHEKALRDGRYTFQPPFGYMRGNRKGIHEINPDYGSYLAYALISIAEGAMSVKESLEWFNDNCLSIQIGEHGKIKMDKWRKWIVNPYYAGVVEMNKQVRARNEHGLHEPLITLDQHERIVAAVNNHKKLHKGPIRGGNPRFPMCKILFCENCWRNNRIYKFTGSDNTNGKTDKVYSRYICRGCKMSLTRDAVHEQVELIMKRLDFSDSGRKEIFEALNELWSSEEKSLKLGVEIKKRDLAVLRQRKNRVMSQMLEERSPNMRQVFREELERTVSEIEKEEKETKTLENELRGGRRNFLSFALDYIDHMGTQFFKLPLDEVAVCKDILFPGGFWVGSDKKIYTREISALYRERTTKMDNELSKNALMVGCEGLEPPTSSV